VAKRERHEEDERSKKRRQKRRKRFIFRWIAVLAVAALVATVVRYWDKLSPDVLISEIGDFFTGGSSDGFPIDVSGNSMYQLETTENCTVLLSDTHLVMYNGKGNEVMRRTHSFADPMLRTAGKYMLIAERGGRRLQLETRSKTIITHTTGYDIVTAAVHTNGNVAVVTAAEQGYNARLTVYGKDGTVVYERLCSTLLTDVAFSPNGKQLAVATVSADKGAIYSAIEVLSLHSADSAPIYAYSGNDVLLCRVSYLSGSLITAVGDTAVWMYHPQKEKCDTYAVTDVEMKAFAIGDSTVAVITQPYGSSGDGTLAYIKSNGTAVYTAPIQGICRDVAAYKNTYAVLTDGYLYKVGSRNITETTEIPSDGKMVGRIGDAVTVLGLQNVIAY